MALKDMVMEGEGLPGGSTGKETTWPCRTCQETQVRSLGQATHSSYFCLENSLDRVAWQTIQSMGLQRVRHDWSSMHTHTEREQEEKFKIPCKDMQRMLSCVRLFATPWTHEAPLSRNFSGKNIRVGCHFLLQGIFLTQVSNQRLLCLLHWQADSLPLCHLGFQSKDRPQATG